VRSPRTSDAPTTAFASVQLRGYKAVQYLGEFMSSLEFEERIHLADRWTSTVFAGAAILYGDGVSGSDFDNPYPDIGAGVQSSPTSRQRSAKTTTTASI
jgi:hypothetical protein